MGIVLVYPPVTISRVPKLFSIILSVCQTIWYHYKKLRYMIKFDKLRVTKHKSKILVCFFCFTSNSLFIVCIRNSVYDVLMTTLKSTRGCEIFSTSCQLFSCTYIASRWKKLGSVKVFKAAVNSPREEKKCEGTRQALCRMNKRIHCVPTRGMATGILQ